MSAGSEFKIVSGEERLKELRAQLREIAIGADETRFEIRDLASYQERIAENCVNKIKDVNKDKSYTIRPPHKKLEDLLELERTLASGRNNAKIFSEVEKELGAIYAAADLAEVKLGNYAGAFINVSGSKDAIDKDMVKVIDTAWRKVVELKDLYDEFIPQLAIKHLVEIPLREIAAAKETLDDLRNGRLRLVKIKEIKENIYVVQNGDTLSGIAHEFDIPWRKLWEANIDILPDPNKIYSGQKLIIPNIEKTIQPDAKNQDLSESNLRLLATIIMSEASVGTNEEKIAVGWVVINRGLTNKGLASNQEPTKEIMEMAYKILSGEIPDNTDGATHFYSPRSMPKEGQSTNGYDVNGGLERIGNHEKTYRPGWSLRLRQVIVPGTREWYFKFYK